jgi:RimJ/RimL family protein N-acetyltransferase
MEITTARLVLREMETDDWPVVLAYENDERYLRYYVWTERGESLVRDYVQKLVDWRFEQPRRKFQLAITLPQDGTLIGICGIRRKPDNEFEGDIGYELNPEYWGRGYATEAARAVVAFGFEHLRLHRVSSWCNAANLASAHVLERVGMRQEGRLREDRHYKGRRWDTLLYGLLKHEWPRQPEEQAT